MSEYMKMKASIEAEEIALQEKKNSLDSLRLKELEEECIDMKKRIIAFGIRPEMLFAKEELQTPRAVRKRPQAKKTGTIPPKYHDGHGNTWGGGPGPKPQWFTAALAAGKSEADMLIAKPN